MPGKPLTIRRWQAAAGLVLITASFVIGLLAVTQAVKANHHAITRASEKASLALQIQHVLIKARRGQLQALHDADLHTCRRIHRLNVVERASVRRNINQSKPFLEHPGPFTRAQIERGIESLRRLLGDLKKADCLAVPPLPKPPPTPTTTTQAKQPSG